MNKKYKNYIDGLNLNKNKAYGTCEIHSKKMKAIFPELVLVRGHYNCPLDGLSEHWWLKTEDGLIVDPTIVQFVPGFEYIELDESLPEPTGKCPNCGEYTFNNESLHEKCAKEYLAYLNSV